MSLAEQIAAAMYSASAYGLPTKLTHGDDVAYIVSEDIYEAWRMRQLDGN